MLSLVGYYEERCRRSRTPLDMKEDLTGFHVKCVSPHLYTTERKNMLLWSCIFMVFSSSIFITLMEQNWEQLVQHIILSTLQNWSYRLTLGREGSEEMQHNVPEQLPAPKTASYLSQIWWGSSRNTSDGTEQRTAFCMGMDSWGRMDGKMLSLLDV